MSNLQDAAKAAYEKILELEFTSSSGKILELLAQLAKHSEYSYAQLFAHGDKEGIYFSNFQGEENFGKEVLVFEDPFDESYLAIDYDMEFIRK